MSVLNEIYYMEGSDKEMHIITIGGLTTYVDPERGLHDHEQSQMRALMKPGSHDSAWEGITAWTFQGVATLITSRSPYTIEGLIGVVNSNSIW